MILLPLAIVPPSAKPGEWYHDSAFPSAVRKVVLAALQAHSASTAGWERSAFAWAATWRSGRRSTARSWPQPAFIRSGICQSEVFPGLPELVPGAKLAVVEVIRFARKGSQTLQVGGPCNASNPSPSGSPERQTLPWRGRPADWEKRGLAVRWRL